MSNASCIVIPAYNEEATIFEVVSALKHIADVIVVDDGSSDSTADLASRAGAKFVSRNAVNAGYESALRSGFCSAVEAQYSYLVTCDADGQHNPEDVERAFAELRKGHVFVVGQRPRLPRLGERLLAFIHNFFWDLRDPCSGLKGYALGTVTSSEIMSLPSLAGSELAIRYWRENRGVATFDITVAARKGVSRYGGDLITLPKFTIMAFCTLLNFRA